MCVRSLLLLLARFIFFNNNYNNNINECYNSNTITIMLTKEQKFEFIISTFYNEILNTMNKNER